jgi:hypothetical protein
MEAASTDVPSLMAFTETFGITCPELSVTRPVSVADSNCANIAPALKARQKAQTQTRKLWLLQVS